MLQSLPLHYHIKNKTRIKTDIEAKTGQEIKI